MFECSEILAQLELRILPLLPFAQRRESGDSSFVKQQEAASSLMSPKDYAIWRVKHALAPPYR
jgi:hypothetical protein